MRKMLVLISVLAAVATACGGGGSSPSASPSGRTSTSPAGQTPPNCRNESTGNVFTLAMRNTRFVPPCLVVRSQQSIHITNEDSFTHNFTITGTQVDVDVPGGKFFNGESAGLKPGTYPFFCKFHRSQGMVGTIVVK